MAWRLYCRQAAAVIAVALLGPQLLAWGAESGISTTVASKKPSRVRIQFQPPEHDVFANKSVPIAVQPPVDTAEKPAATNRNSWRPGAGKHSDTFERSLSGARTAEPGTAENALPAPETDAAPPVVSAPIVYPPRALTSAPAPDGPLSSTPAPVVAPPRAAAPAPVVLPSDLPHKPTAGATASTGKLPTADPSVPTDDAFQQNSRWRPNKSAEPAAASPAEKSPWSAFIDVMPPLAKSPAAVPAPAERDSSEASEQANPLRENFAPAPDNALRSAFDTPADNAVSAARNFGAADSSNAETRSMEITGAPAMKTTDNAPDPRTVLRLIDLVGLRKPTTVEPSTSSVPTVKSSEAQPAENGPLNQPDTEVMAVEPTAPGLFAVNQDTSGTLLPQVPDSVPASQLVSAFPASTGEHSISQPAASVAGTTSTAPDTATAPREEASVPSGALSADDAAPSGVQINIRATKPPATAETSALRSVLVLRRESDSAAVDLSNRPGDNLAPPPTGPAPADTAVVNAPSPNSPTSTTPPPLASVPTPLSELAQHIQVPARAVTSAGRIPLAVAPSTLGTFANTPTVSNAPATSTSAPSVTPAVPDPAPVTNQAPSLLTEPPTPVATPVPTSAEGSALLDVPEAQRLRVDPRETRALRTDSDVTRAQSSDPRICDVIQFAPRELTIIGKQPGVTRIDYWQDGQTENRQSYWVSVGPDKSDQQRAQDQSAKLREVLRDLYPASEVRLEQQNGNLLVTGAAKCKAEAIAIISLIRRMHTIPVIDNLQVVQPQGQEQ